MAPQSVDAGPGMALGKAGHHDMVRPAQLFTVRHLATADVLKNRPGHAGTAQHPGGLDERWCMDHAGGIDPRFAAGLEEKGHIEHHETAAMPGRPPEKAGLIAAYQGMDQRFKPGEQFGVTDDTGAKELTIDASSYSITCHHPGKGAADRSDSSAAWTVEPVHTAIGIVDESATAGEHAGNGGLSHADRTSQAEHEHRC